MRPDWIMVGPKHNDYCLYGRKRDSDTERQRGNLGKTEAETSNTATSQRMSRIASNHQRLQEARKASSIEASEGAGPC